VVEVLPSATQGKFWKRVRVTPGIEFINNIHTNQEQAVSFTKSTTVPQISL